MRQNKSLFHETDRSDVEHSAKGSAKDSAKDSAHRRTAAVFIAFLAVFTLLSVLLPKRVFSPEENRYLALKPEFLPDRFLDGSYGKAYETYLSDQFPLRGKLVAAKVNVERLMMKGDVNGVYFGKDGYYIEKFDSEDLMTAQMEKNAGFLAEAADRFSERLGAEHVRILLVPSASQILRDKLPPFAAPADQKQVTESVREKLTHPELLLPVEETLLSHGNEPVYYRTDHHWTTLGAYYAYRLYTESIGLVPHSGEEYEKTVVTEDFSGTIQSKVSLAVEPDSITLYRLREPEEYSVYYDGLPKEHRSLYSEEALSGKDKYSVFLDGNHGWTKIVKHGSGKGEEEGKKTRKLLIIKDSYAHSFAPFAAAHFDEVHMVDLRYFNMKLSDFTGQEGITDVLILYQIPGFAGDTGIFKMPG